MVSGQVWAQANGTFYNWQRISKVKLSKVKIASTKIKES